MKRIVVDTNIIFSALLNTDSKVGSLLLDSSGVFVFHSCQYLKEELVKHQTRLQDLSGLPTETLDKLKSQVFQPLQFMDEDTIPFAFWHSSLPLVRDVDMDDIAFVALNEFLGDSLLWTGDKQLLKGLRAKGYKKCISTGELYDLRKELEKFSS